MTRYRKKLTEVDALQLTGGNHPEVAKFLARHGATFLYDAITQTFIIHTRHGKEDLAEGDWAVYNKDLDTGNKTCRYKPRAFEATYEQVTA